MNASEHLLTCLGEEGSEISQAVAKSVRFGLDDRNVLDPTGPTNLERLVNELNDLLGVAALLVESGVLPPNWSSAEKQCAKKKKVREFMAYAVRVGALGVNTDRAPRAPVSGSAGSWQPIKTAPHNASWVEVKMRDGTIQRAHWASDLSGEEQPPFQGWFVDRKTYMLGIPEPAAWRPCDAVIGPD